MLLLAGLTLAVLAGRRIRSRVVRRAAVLLGPVSIALIVGTTMLAAGAI